MMTSEQASDDEAQVRQLIADQMSAICAKDLGRLMDCYAAEAEVFDVKPPFSTKGAGAWRRTWEACLPQFPDSFETEIRDLSLTVDGDMALAHWHWRFAGAAQSWTSSAAGYRRIRGAWRIVHEYGSVPFHPENGMRMLAQ